MTSHPVPLVSEAEVQRYCEFVSKNRLCQTIHGAPFETRRRGKEKNMTGATTPANCQEPVYGPLGTCVGTCRCPAAGRLFGMNLCQEHFDAIKRVMKGNAA